MPSIFSKIIKDEVPSYKVAETDEFVAFLDIHPNAIGHTLCVTKEEVDKIFELPEDTYLKLLAFSRKVAKALEKTIECKRVGMSVVGLEVAHVHVHLIPISKMKEMTFQHKVSMTDEEFKELAEKIHSNVEL